MTRWPEPRLFATGMIGSMGVPTDYTASGPRGLFATSLGVGGMDGRDISLAAGHAGADIVGVIHPSRAHGDVAATVSHGQFAHWLPADAPLASGVPG